MISSQNIEHITMYVVFIVDVMTIISSLAWRATRPFPFYIIYKYNFVTPTLFHVDFYQCWFFSCYLVHSFQCASKIYKYAGYIKLNSYLSI